MPILQSVNQFKHKIDLIGLSEANKKESLILEQLLRDAHTADKFYLQVKKLEKLVLQCTKISKLLQKNDAEFLAKILGTASSSSLFLKKYFQC